MVRVASDQQIAEPIQYDAHGTEYEHWNGKVHRVLVVDVRESLQGFHHGREAERGQEDAHHQHREDIDSGPSERVFQTVFALLAAFGLDLLLDIGGVFLERGRFELFERHDVGC